MAEVGGQKYLIEPDSSIDSKWQSLLYKEIYQVLDLDGDGKLEAIISAVDNGNCCALACYIASHRGFSLVMDSKGNPIKLSSQAFNKALVNIKFADETRSAQLDVKQ